MEKTVPIVLQVALVLWLVASPVIALVIGVGIARADRMTRIREAAAAAAMTERHGTAATDSDALLAGDTAEVAPPATQRHPSTKRLHLIVPQRDGAGLNG